MGPFRRKKDTPEQTPAGQTLMGDDLVPVPQEEIDRYIESMLHEVAKVYPGDISEDETIRYRAAFLMIIDDMPRLQAMPSETFAVAQSVVRFGYLTRRIEVEDVGPLDDPHPGFPELLDRCLEEGKDEDDPVTAACINWALREPEHPESDEPSLLWLIPGVGGQMRDQLSEYAVISLSPEGGLPEGVSLGELKKCWRFGFFYRCCEEVLGDQP